MVDELAIRERNALIDMVFDGLDISKQTRKEYKYRIRSFLTFIGLHGLNVNSFLEYKRLLATKDEMAISTKNKYLAAARIF